MKKSKRIVVSALAVVMLVGMMVIPADAATGADRFDEPFLGYTCTGTLTFTDTRATATLEAVQESGPLVPNHTLSIAGTVYYQGSRGETPATFDNSSTSLICSAYGTTEATSTRATAVYSFNGTQVGSLRVPKKSV